MSLLKQKELPLGLLVICGIIMLVEYYFNIPALSAVANELKVWVVILSSFALVIGGFSLLRRIYRSLSTRRGTALIYDLIGLCLLVSMLFAGFYYGTTSYQWGWLFDNFYYAVRATMYASGSFYVFSTWYRAMRVRNIDSAIMIFFAILMILGFAPIFALISPEFLTIKDFLQNVGQLGARRGFQLSATMGMAILTLRIIMGMETSAIGLIPGVEEQ
jgi:hypothetical protein